MSRRVWLALALAAIMTVSIVASSVAANSATTKRPPRITKGLDYMHARQTEAGGFGTMANTVWGVLGAVASGERMGSAAWSVKSKNPWEYLQANSMVVGASADTNAPVYYARAMMSYIAVGKNDYISHAGNPAVNLLTELTSYQDWTAGTGGNPATGTGSFSPSNPSSPPSQDYDVHTTAWAILAMHAKGEDTNPRFTAARDWLKTQQHANGGFSSESRPGESPNVEDTSLCVQALIASGMAKDNPQIVLARTYLLSCQNANAGFPHKAGGITRSADTSAAIQAAWAMGEDPGTDADWRNGDRSPETALAALQQRGGSYASARGDHSNLMGNTSWALIALRGRPFTNYPRSMGPASPAFVFRPKVTYITPKNGAKFTKTRVVLIQAKYTDGKGGTGIKPSACRVYVDNVDKSKPAIIGHYGLSLELKKVANGEHIYKLLVEDYAGNVKTVENKFSVDVASPSPTTTPTTPPTYVPPTTPYTPPTHASTPLYTITPTTTASSTTPYNSGSPYPYSSGSPLSGQPVPSPSGSSSPAGAAGGSGGGSVGGYVGGTLLAMLPLGALASYFLFRRRELALNGASEGKVLEGGGSSFDRAKGALGKSKDIIKPAGS